MTARKPSIWTDERKETFARMWALGLTIEIIAGQLGVSMNAVRVQRQIQGLPKRHNGPKAGPRAKPKYQRPRLVPATVRPKPALPPSDIPWPTPRECMRRRA